MAYPKLTPICGDYLRLAQRFRAPIETFDIISTDVFDTVLLRDASVQLVRFMEYAQLLSHKLSARDCLVAPDILFRIRCEVHKLAYRTVAFERPGGDATLAGMAGIQASLLGVDASLIPLFIEAELKVERKRLVSNKSLCGFLRSLRDQGKRIIAISDTYLSVQDVSFLIESLIDDSPIEKVYTSSELGLTKHAGSIFTQVAGLESVPSHRIVHCGDNRHSDFVMARAAGYQAVLLPRPAWVQMLRKLSAVTALFNPEIRSVR
jgi:predicted HAD superfamily hydrolase